MIPAQVSFHPEPAQPEGLRSRKKIKTRLAIEDAGLALFDEQGYEATTVDQIAERAEVSTTTFFRYFPGKDEVVLNDHGEQLPELHRAIVERPAGETDLEAFRHAVLDEWVTAIDPVRTAHKAQIVGSSPVLQGLSYKRGTKWLATITDAFVTRHGFAADDPRASLAARVVLSVLASAVEGWLEGGCRDDLSTAVDQRFDLMATLGHEWAT